VPTTNHHNKLFDTRSAALHYCTQAVSGTVCLICRYLLRIKYSAFCTRCSEFETLSGKNNSSCRGCYYSLRSTAICKVYQVLGVAWDLPNPSFTVW